MRLATALNQTPKDFLGHQLSYSCLVFAIAPCEPFYGAMLMGVNFKLGSAYLADKIDCAFRCPQVCEAQCNNCLLLLLLHIKFYRIYMKTTAGKLQGTWFEGLRNFSIEECYCSCSWMSPSH